MEEPVFLSEAGSKGIEFKALCTGKIIILAAHFTRIITIIGASEKKSVKNQQTVIK